jgi:GntR family transcriptional repressor for pyruvate dehydrogenase complex
MPEQKAHNTARFSTIERKLLSQEIIQRILDEIRTGNLNPGDSLPSERELALQFGVSRPSVREALRVLTYMRVVEVRQGDGNYIGSLAPQHLAQPLEEILQLLNDVTCLEILEARCYIEGAVAGLAALHADDATLAELDQSLARAEKCVESPEAFLEADLELHNIIVEATQNPILISLNASIVSMGIETRKRTVYIPGVREQALERHKAIVDAIRQKDPELSRKTMEAHIRDVMKAVDECLD